MREHLPEFAGFSYDEFAKAAAALAETDIVRDLPNPLAKQAVAFVFEGSGQPQACEDLCAAALHFRIGTALPTQPLADPSTIDPADLISSDVYKRLRGFIPKAGKQPACWAKWKLIVEKEAKGNDDLANKN